MEEDGDAGVMNKLAAGGLNNPPAGSFFLGYARHKGVGGFHIGGITGLADLERFF